MFDNTVKNVVSIGLLFSLCAPCSFASAQKMPPNLFIPSNSGGNRTNRQNIGDFSPFLRAMQQATQLAQPQPSALERLWQSLSHHMRESLGVQTIILSGRIITSAEDLSNAIRVTVSEPVEAFNRLSELGVKIRLPLDTILKEAIPEIYNLDNVTCDAFLKNLKK